MHREQIMQIVRKARFLETLLRKFGGSEMTLTSPSAVHA